MIEWLKTKLVIIEALVIVGLIVFIVVSKNITVNHYTTNSSQSISNAYSSSAALNQTMVYDQFRMQGKWEIKEKKFESHKEVIEFYNTLNPIQLMFVKETFLYRSVISSSDQDLVWVITYPEISETKQIESKDSGVIKK